MKFKRWIGGLMAMGLITTTLMAGGAVPASAAGKTFTQGLWRGQDPRASFDSKTGYYYFVEDTVEGMVMFRSKSLIDRGDTGERRVMPSGFPLHAPVYVESMNGTRYNKWYAFGLSAWECDGDPFTGTWKNIGGFGLKGWTLDHYAFKVESGTYAGQWFLMWAGGEDKSNTSGFSAEDIYISKMLTPSSVQSKGESKSDAILHCAKGNGWTGWDVEAPVVVQKNGTITMIYSGTDTKSTRYALGLCVYKGGDITKKDSWTDLSAGAYLSNAAFSNNKKGDYGTPYGTAVAAPIPSADGTEMWFYYHAKIYYDIDSSISGDREAWTRIINLAKMTWTTKTVDGVTYDIPDLGSPQKMGSSMPMPSGDPGQPSRGYYHFEAEHAVPFGWIFTKTLQSKTGSDGEPYNLMYEGVRGRGMSLSGCMSHFDWFAEDPNGDGTSGLHFHNVPRAKSLVISAGSKHANGGFDILVNGTRKAGITFEQGTSNFTFKNYRVKLDIPAGATVTLRYTKGAYDDSAVDFLFFEDTVQFSGDVVGGSSAATTTGGATPQTTSGANTPGTSGTSGNAAGDTTNGSGGTDTAAQPDDTTTQAGAATAGTSAATGAASATGTSSTAESAGSNGMGAGWIVLIVAGCLLLAGGGTAGGLYAFKLRKKAGEAGGADGSDADDNGA